MTVMKRVFKPFTILFLFMTCCANAASLMAAVENGRPNVLIILTDDQSPGTIGCYGGTIVPTPNLDRLAREGMRFTQAYATSQCTPTRASLLSGQYTARNRMWHVIGWYGMPWARVAEEPFQEQFPPLSSTLASSLRVAGYKTGLFGKWHLTTNSHGNYNGLNPEFATLYGFDVAGPPLSKQEFREGADRGVSTLTSQAIDFLTENKNRPWFCLLSHHMIHGKVVAPQELTHRYEEKGYGHEGPNRAVYLAGLETIDQSVGRILEALDKTGQADETLIIFLSDNGGIDERLEHRSLPLPHPAAPRLEVNLREYDNAPLRDGKGSIYEGGTRVPFIVRWPGKVAAGKMSEVPVHVIDLFPTMVDCCGAVPGEGNILDGRSLNQLLKTGEDQSLVERPIFQYSPIYDLNWGLTPSCSVRVGDWKLIEFFGDRFDEHHQYHVGAHRELYHLKRDPGEQNNRIDSEPKKAEQLQQQLDLWMESVQVKRPVLNPHFDPSRAFLTTNKKPSWLLENQSYPE